MILHRKCPKQKVFFKKYLFLHMLFKENIIINKIVINLNLLYFFIMTNVGNSDNENRNKIFNNNNI